ncbi:unnamed protein product [Ectocarpus sp. 8 AP-2014]
MTGSASRLSRQRHDTRATCTRAGRGLSWMGLVVLRHSAACPPPCCRDKYLFVLVWYHVHAPRGNGGGGARPLGGSQQRVCRSNIRQGDLCGPELEKPNKKGRSGQPEFGHAGCNRDNLRGNNIFLARTALSRAEHGSAVGAGVGFGGQEGAQVSVTV